MLFSKRLIGAQILAAVSFSPAMAANISVAFGQADFEMLYAVTLNDETSRGQTVDDFDYVDLGLSVNRGEYTFGFNISQLLEQEVDEYTGNGQQFIGSYDTKRDSYSFSVTRNLSEKVYLAAGYFPHI